jgi:hypothetical protein
MAAGAWLAGGTAGMAAASGMAAPARLAGGAAGVAVLGPGRARG